jgi:hypothetical protein
MSHIVPVAHGQACTYLEHRCVLLQAGDLEVLVAVLQAEDHSGAARVLPQFARTLQGRLEVRPLAARALLHGLGEQLTVWGAAEPRRADGSEELLLERRPLDVAEVHHHRAGA